MKNFTLSFYAQSLDNQAPDQMELNQHPLSTEDVVKRQSLAQQIDEVSLRGSQVFPEGSHVEGSPAAFLLGDNFILSMPSKQLDDAGRNSRILCYGRVPDELLESWPSDVVESLTAFAGRIGRTISEDKAVKAQCAAKAIIEKKQRNNMHRKALWVAVIAIVLVVICIIYWTVFKKD